MLLAVRHPKGTGGRNRDPANREDSSQFRRVQRARSVIAYCPELVEQVIDGKLGLDEALKGAGSGRVFRVFRVFQRFRCSTLERACGTACGTGATPGDCVYQSGVLP